LNWVDTCRQWLLNSGGAPKSADPLLAFGGPSPGQTGDFVSLEQEALALAPHQQERIIALLSEEVDGDQAAMFSRRFRSLVDKLGTRSEPLARVLRVGLIRRTTEILAGPAPIAMRVRAAVDFYYSHTAVLVHSQEGVVLPTPAHLVAGAKWTRVAVGLWHARVAGLSLHGPVQINLLRLTQGQIRTIDARQRGSLAEIVQESGAAAGVSGGFFLYSEPEITPPSQRTDPVGLLVSERVLHNPPVFRRASLLQHGDGTWDVDVVGMQHARIGWVGGQITVEALNDPEHSGPTVFNRAWGRTAPGWGMALVGCSIVGVGENLPIPLAGCVISLPRGCHPPCGPVDIALPGRALVSAIAGGPMLVSAKHPVLELEQEDFAAEAPPITFSQDETFDQNLLPRMGAGVTREGALIFAAVDGRDFENAPGLTLRGLAEVLRALGCVEALNLDGGSSKRMVVNGRQVDCSSTEIVASPRAARVRPVHTAILLFPLAH